MSPACHEPVRRFLPSPPNPPGPGLGAIVTGFVVLAMAAMLVLASCREDAEDPRSDADMVYAAVLQALVAEHLVDQQPKLVTVTTPTTTPALTVTPTPTPSASSTTAGQRPQQDDEDDDEKKLLQVFVEPLGDGYVIDLAVQARVVTALETVARVRFIDHRAEAIDEDQPGQPVREGGLLVGLGPIVGGTAQRTVLTRRYLKPAGYIDGLARISGVGENLQVALAPV